jgi:hypothetical protein
MRLSCLLSWLALATLVGAPSAFSADSEHSHGLWVWKGPAILAAPDGTAQLRDFCRAAGITEAYVSILSHGELTEEAGLAHLVHVLHASGIRVEALLSSETADEAGKHRETLLARVRTVLAFNARHPSSRIDGIHLDIEPQQRAENKGAGNLRFLPGLTATLREVRALAEPAGLSVNADIQEKLLKGSRAERDSLLKSVPRLTLMLYELDHPDDGRSPEEQADKLRLASRHFLELAYEGLDGPALARLAIGLRTPDYGALMPRMLDTVEQSNRSNPHYLGWALHEYSPAGVASARAP